VTTGEGEPAADAEAAPSGLLTCYRHPSRETGVRCARCDRPICPQCMVPASVGFQCPECVTEGRRSVRPARTVYGGKVNRSGLDVTRALIAVNVVVFIITVSSGANPFTGQGTSPVYDNFALIPLQVLHGEWWRLFSSMFLHFGIMHIFFNMWALLVIGTPLEAMLGRLRYLVLYLFSGVGGALLSMTFGPINERAAGASGAIFGLFGAFYVITRRRGLETGGIVTLIVINLALSFTISNIDWRGHVGGLITGAAVAFVFAWAPSGPQRDRLQALGCVALALILAAAGFVGVHHVQTKCRSLVESQVQNVLIERALCGD
jgi:membrane associated rhomboid family serine protease